MPNQVEPSDAEEVYASAVRLPLGIPFMPAIAVLVLDHIAIGIVVGIVTTCFYIFEFVLAPFFSLKHFKPISILVLWIAFGIGFAMRNSSPQWWIPGAVLVLAFNLYFFMALKRAPVKLF